MEDFYERVTARAVSIDELLSDAYEPLPGQKSHTDLAARRLAAWCRSSASGDWSLFARRLARDGLTFTDVLERFAGVRRSGTVPRWIEDAVWIGEALSRPTSPADAGPPVAFEELLEPVVREADALLWSGVGSHVRAPTSPGVPPCLRRSLLVELSSLSAPAVYERFAEARENGGAHYAEFVADMKADGFRRLFDDKPVLLRLMASVTRQWIETSRELVTRLTTDLPSIRRDLLQRYVDCQVTSIDAGLSDPHNFGRSVRIIGFEDGSKVVYKPKDMCAEAAWHALVERLNRSAPVDLQAVTVLPRPGYGWARFIEHTNCDDFSGFARFFRRAGAWLALFHCFVSVDMHQENIIAAGAHPIPIDLEMILQALDGRIGRNGIDDDDIGRAHEEAMRTVIDSVMTVGLLPAYGRHSGNKIFSIGGITSNSAPRMKLTWTDINFDTMAAAKTAETATIANLPSLGGHLPRLGEYIDEFVSGFDDYAAFLRRQHPGALLDGFAGLKIRTVIRPTTFYYMLLQRLRDHRTMHDGVEWSAQADFPARLADWEHNDDATWPLHRAERAAVVELNVPHFVMDSDGSEIRDAAGTSVNIKGTPGLERATNRLRGLSEHEVAWQIEVIRQNTGTLTGRPSAAGPLIKAEDAPNRATFVAEADVLANTLSMHAVRRGPSAAWIGLDWLGDSEVSQLVVLGPDLYNGSCGIGLFLAAHAAVTNDHSSRALAIAAVAQIRNILKGRNPARTARLLGLGGGLGLGSVVYGLSVSAALLNDDTMLADAQRAAELITDEIIAADRQLDVLGGSAGAILGLLRLHRQTGSADALRRATDCGRHLLAHDRVGPDGQRMWVTQAFGRPLNGMSHGAAGFAYALASLASATGDEAFTRAAYECLAFEESTFDTDRADWSDLRRRTGDTWPSKWCYGAPGIGLSRAAMAKHTKVHSDFAEADMLKALAAVDRAWPNTTDTLCCGALGSIEFCWEAGGLLERADLLDQASRHMHAVVEAARLAGDYRWNSGTSRFNLGLFRGIAGVGYTLLRRVDDSLPNVLIWE